MRSYTVKEKHISSTATEIPRHTQTDTDPLTILYMGYNNYIKYLSILDKIIFA